MLGVFVGVPHVENPPMSFLESCLYMHKPETMIFRPQPGMALDVARNRLFDVYLKDTKKPGFFLFADVDAEWHPESLIRMMERDLPMVTAGIYRASFPPMPTFGPYVGKNDAGKHVYSFGDTAERIGEIAEQHDITEQSETAQVLPKTDNDLMEIDGCGMHFCLIKREVIEAIREPWFRMPGWGSGEDFYFCRKVRERGFPIYADLSVHTGHYVGKGQSIGLPQFVHFWNNTDVYKVTGTNWEVPSWD